MKRSSSVDAIQYRDDYNKTAIGEAILLTAAAHVYATDKQAYTVLIKHANGLEVMKAFRVEGWGEVGEANLEAFVPFDGFKNHRDLEIGETTEGRIQNTLSDKKPERITRTR